MTAAAACRFRPHLRSALAVGACDLNGRPLAFSNFGDAYLENGILAPGDYVKGASPHEHVALRSGTSFATPIVTGVAALLLSRLRQEEAGRRPQVVARRLADSAALRRRRRNGAASQAFSTFPAPSRPFSARAANVPRAVSASSGTARFAPFAAARRVHARRRTFAAHTNPNQRGHHGRTYRP